MSIIAKGYIKKLQEPVNVYVIVTGGNVERVYADREFNVHVLDSDLLEEHEEMDALDHKIKSITHLRKEGLLFSPNSFIVNE